MWVFTLTFKLSFWRFYFVQFGHARVLGRWYFVTVAYFCVSKIVVGFRHLVQGLLPSSPLFLARCLSPSPLTPLSMTRPSVFTLQPMLLSTGFIASLQSEWIPLTCRKPSVILVVLGITQQVKCSVQCCSLFISDQFRRCLLGTMSGSHRRESWERHKISLVS